MIDFKELNSEQRREAVNTQQRYAAYREAEERAKGFRGSTTWTQIRGRDYLVRSYYTKSGIRRQTSRGLRSKETEAIKLDYDRGRTEAQKRLKNLKALIIRQSAINRAIGLGRVPLLGAKIIGALDRVGFLGADIQVIGTNAIYAYEAAAGVHIDPGLITTDEIDWLLGARSGLTVVASDNVSPPSLLHLLQKIDRSFVRSAQTFRAVNDDGYLVDLIKPLRNPPWLDEPGQVGDDDDDLLAVEIEGLVWHQSAPAFEAVAIDVRGEPRRIVATDPRAWVAHKLWLSKRPDREPLERRRDEAQARVIGRLVAAYLQHLPYAAHELPMLPKTVFEQALPLFSA